MGWIQFIQTAKEASWHDCSLYLIRGLVLFWLLTWCNSDFYVYLSLEKDGETVNRVTLIQHYQRLWLFHFPVTYYCMWNKVYFLSWLCIDVAIPSVHCCCHFVSIRSSVTDLTSESFSWCVGAFILEWKWVSVCVRAGVWRGRLSRWQRGALTSLMVN